MCMPRSTATPPHASAPGPDETSRPPASPHRSGIIARLRQRLRYPPAMREAPRLSDRMAVPAPEPRYALLVNPFYPKDPYSSFGKHVLAPSLALTSIAAATPPQWEVKYWDENLLQGPPPTRPFPSVVGITVHLTTARRAYELAKWYRERGAVVVLGGPHVLSCPDEVAPCADAIAIGEGTQLWPQILEDAEHGELRKTYSGTYRRPYREDPVPRREILPRRHFLTTMSLIATRGCHNRCGFCYLATEGLHLPFQAREVHQVAREFEESDEPYAVFTDNNLGSKKDYLRSLCRALRPLGRIWSAAVTIDVADEPSLVREMALAGCTGVFVGFESLSPENLTDARKKSPHPDDYARRVGVFHEYGIQVNGSFVLGFDHDRPGVFDRTTDWIEENRLACATFHMLTPYPGTPLFKQLEAEDRLLHRDWSLYDTGHVVFRPRHMSPQELEQGYVRCYERIFSMRSVWERRPDRLGESLPYFAMSLLYKRINLVWPLLIRLGLTRAAWCPLVEAARQKHLRWRKSLMSQGDAEPARIVPVSPGV